MSRAPEGFNVRLFYSYSHKDAQYRDSMEKGLALLKQDGLIREWHDQSIVPGGHISKEIRQQMSNADILVFLFSNNFFASTACKDEWHYAKTLASAEKPISRVPVILKQCPWEDFLGSDDLKALPTDGRPISTFRPHDAGWTDVYMGIKALVSHLKQDFTVKPSFLSEMEDTEFISHHRIKLQDLFIFLTLSRYPFQTTDNRVQQDTLTTVEELLTTKYGLLHGEEASGKTALVRYLFLHLAHDSRPVLFVDLRNLPSRSWDDFLRETYETQFNGDYTLWQKRPDKTILLDNLTPNPACMEFILHLKPSYERVFVTVSSDIYNSFFKDEVRLSDFRELRLLPLTHRQQETLIKRRLELLESHEPLTDGFVDKVENHINSVIISHKVVPRYPFFVLSILQTYEAFMPTDLSITSYGYCYHALIVARLVKTGISTQDTDLGACFNFADHLAFEVYQRTAGAASGPPFDFDFFIKEYKDRFVLPNAVLHRLKDETYGIIASDGHFRTQYIYYFFLGRFLARHSNKDEIKTLLDQMCDHIHLRVNFLTLLFTLHHTDDKQIIENILVRTMCALDNIPAAVLDHTETKRFGDLVGALHNEILSNDTVDDERGKMRDRRDKVEEIESDREQKDDKLNRPADDLYRILKNNEILGQIPRNKQGSLEKGEIAQIIETVADGGLRLVNSVLKDDAEIRELAHRIKTRFPAFNSTKLEKMLRFVAFVWTMENIEKVVETINLPELRELVQAVVQARATPAYDLIGYFTQLDSAQELTTKEKAELDKLWKRHRDVFIKRVLSIRTQFYMNTHRGKARIEQAVCTQLGIKYKPRGQRLLDRS